MNDDEDMQERGDETPYLPAPFTPQWTARMKEAQRKLGEAMREVERLDWQRRNMPRLS